jgi:hypothetical protein
MKSNVYNSTPDTSLNIDLIESLSTEFEVENTPAEVFAAAYDWFYMPRAPDTMKIAEQVVKDAVKKYSENKTCPDWIMKVHEMKKT